LPELSPRVRAETQRIRPTCRREANANRDRLVEAFMDESKSRSFGSMRAALRTREKIYSKPPGPVVVWANGLRPMWSRSSTLINGEYSTLARSVLRS
jgi:hypothetical protein